MYPLSGDFENKILTTVYGDAVLALCAKYSPVFLCQSYSRLLNDCTSNLSPPPPYACC